MRKTDLLSEKVLLLYGFINDPGLVKGINISLPSYSQDGVAVDFNGVYNVADEMDYINSSTNDGEPRYIATEKALLTVEDLRAYYERKTGRSVGLYNRN